MTRFSSSDLRQLTSHGLSPQDVSRQREALRRPLPRLNLDRPCRDGDGLVRLSPREKSFSLTLADQARAQGRLMKFVPASGAGTRLFGPLKGSGATPDVAEIPPDLSRFLRHWPRSALAAFLHSPRLNALNPLEDLRSLLKKHPILETQPKAFFPVHRYGKKIRTLLEEQWVNTRAITDDAGRARVHFTVSSDQRPLFEAWGRREGKRLKERLKRRLVVSFSEQDPATDSLLFDEEGRPSRGPQGRLRFRPGGHGALLKNLQETGGDLVFIQNVDNVPREEFQSVVDDWRRVMVGWLIHHQRESARFVSLLREESGSKTLAVVEKWFCGGTAWKPPPRISLLKRRRLFLDRLSRPWRVCGMIPARGEPGGGPYWLKSPQGESGQLVETSELTTPGLRRMGALSTYFNPVDMVVGLRNPQGRSYDLTRYAATGYGWVVARLEGKERVRYVEKPGLWNGGMRGWNTLFIELPQEVFYPVKTVLDVNRRGHSS